MNNAPSNEQQERQTKATREVRTFVIRETESYSNDLSVPSDVSPQEERLIAEAIDDLVANEPGQRKNTEDWDYHIDAVETSNESSAELRVVRRNESWWFEDVHHNEWPHRFIGRLHQRVVRGHAGNQPIRYLLVPVVSNKGKLATALVYHLDTHLIAIGFWKKHVEVGVVDASVQPVRVGELQALNFGLLRHTSRSKEDGIFPVYEVLASLGLPLRDVPASNPCEITSLQDNPPAGYSFILDANFSVANRPNELLYIPPQD